MKLDTWKRVLLRQEGMSLLEILLAMTLLAVTLLAVAPMFVVATQGNAASGDLGVAVAVAREQMEKLRASDYRDLLPGGSLDSNESGFFDDSHENYSVRWKIEDNPVQSDTRIIQVRAIGAAARPGVTPRIVLTSVRSK